MHSWPAAGHSCCKQQHKGWVSSVLQTVMQVRIIVKKMCEKKIENRVSVAAVGPTHFHFMADTL